jgi:hypothetical protein
MVHISLWFMLIDVNILGGSVHIIRKKAEGLLVANKEIGLEINADKTKYMVMSGRITVYRLIIVHLKQQKNSNIWEQS